MEKLSQGKTTLKSIFKSKSGKEVEVVNLQTTIEAQIKEIEDSKKLINFLTIYLGQVMLTKFKQNKYRHYMRVLHGISAKEISNSWVQGSLWPMLLEFGQN